MKDQKLWYFERSLKNPTFKKGVILGKGVGALKKKEGDCDPLMNYAIYQIEKLNAQFCKLVLGTQMISEKGNFYQDYKTKFKKKTHSIFLSGCCKSCQNHRNVNKSDISIGSGL